MEISSTIVPLYVVIVYCFLQQVAAMNSLQKWLLYLLSVLTSVVSYIPAAIYHYVYTEWFTKTTYRQIGERNKHNKAVKQVLDIGTATGGPLSTIIHCFEQARVLGIDYNQHYVPACQKLFKDHPNVDIKHMNFYDLEKEEPETLFDVIIFGSSFMILPDQAKALEIARRKLSKEGKIYFLLTLYEERTLMNRIMEVVKPMLKYLCTVDFGKVTYRRDFESFIGEHGLKATFVERCHGNILLQMAKFYIYEVQKTV